jgi:YidC/Oxa1 family membrane protein insertase
MNMESKRVFLAIIISLAILVGYQYLFVPTTPVPQTTPTGTEQTIKEQLPASSENIQKLQQGELRTVAGTAQDKQIIPAGRDISIESSLYSAVITEVGGGLKSFKLKKFKESLTNDEPKELIKTEKIQELPLYFTWGVAPDSALIPGYAADRPVVNISQQNRSTLTMKSSLKSGIDITRTLEFADQDYQFVMTVDVVNTSQQPLQGAPYLSLTNHPFSEAQGNSWLFSGPAIYSNNELTAIKVDDLKKADKSFTGNDIDWIAYEDPYFMCGIIPKEMKKLSVLFSLSDNDKVATLLSSDAAVIEPQGHKQYTYLIYFGPKKLSILKTVDKNLDRIVDFGWYDIIARPTLYLLNFLYGIVHNYGIAIILVTIIIKLIFWPISQKGMKSMKTMQKIQPKLAKIREKYKDDKERLNQEMMQLYKTYKVNPLGGCLPMVLQIPVFFALYKVLLQTIELRHAPFMLWINDLSAPDRLFIGFDIPYLGGIPVLTLLMGASMFLQQKMSPTAGDPTQAKVMMFLPVVFTFMFLNFASGLVLYWFVNNLLSIAQQYTINRQTN